MTTIVYAQGNSGEIDVPASEKIAVWSWAPVQIYQLVGYPNHPDSKDLIYTTSAGEQYVSSAFSSAARVVVEPGASDAYYEVGAAPVVGEPTTDITGADATFTITGLGAAQGGSTTLIGGTSSTSGNAGGAVAIRGGQPGATGVGGAASVTGAAGGATSGAGGAATVTGGAGTAGNSAGGVATLIGGAGQGTAAGGVVSVTGGASGAGATGNGAAVNITGGAALSTNGSGGQVTIAGGALAGSGAKGGVDITGLQVKSTSATAITAARTLVLADSGAIFTVSQAAAYDIDLPSPTAGAGCRFMFQLVGAAANAVTITVAGSAATFEGTLQNDVTGVVPCTGSTLTFVSGTAALGDNIEVWSTSTTKYFVRAICSANGGITIA